MGLKKVDHGVTVVLVPQNEWKSYLREIDSEIIVTSRPETLYAQQIGCIYYHQSLERSELLEVAVRRSYMANRYPFHELETLL